MSLSVMLSDYERGVTPNPDVLCNKHVKFGALFDHVMSNMDADWLATGHYANLHYSRYGKCKTKPNCYMALDFRCYEENCSTELLLLVRICVCRLPGCECGGVVTLKTVLTI